ncbi:MAG TPA: PPC domain-containing DNA-binding protein [Myxococcota bacterium]|nr:PPC domain-containing DNA-binding protein [Myxococcota bacterium]
MEVKQLPELQGQKRLAVVFGAGEEMMRSLADLAKIRSMPGAYFTGIGALRAAMLGFFDIARREYRRFGIDEQVEVLSLTGNIALEEGEPRIHAHYRGGALQRRHPGRSSPRSARAAHPSR